MLVVPKGDIDVDAADRVAAQVNRMPVGGVPFAEVYRHGGKATIRLRAPTHRSSIGVKGIGRSARGWRILDCLPGGAQLRPASNHPLQQLGAQQLAAPGFTARTKALMNLPATWGAMASTSTPCAARK